MQLLGRSGGSRRNLELHLPKRENGTKPNFQHARVANAQVVGNIGYQCSNLRDLHLDLVVSEITKAMSSNPKCTLLGFSIDFFCRMRSQKRFVT